MDASASISAALRDLLPADDADEAAHGPAFARAAALLLGGATLWIAGAAHRIAEIELYWTSDAHPDPFTHGDPMQREFGRWYFHRQGTSYKGGSFKGLDLAVGSPRVAAGILLRAIVDVERGALVEGSCSVVDHILARTGSASVAALAGAFDLAIDRPPDGASPLALSRAPAAGAPVEIYASARVGLTLKKGADPLRRRFLARPYRFLNEPRRISKGRPYLIVGLHRSGRSPAEIAAITGISGSTITRTIEGYEAGRGRDPEGYRKELNARELCELLGALA
ncbi:MAG: hypothetical protein R3B09_12355 [Nannocystaceae bacterium]